MSLGTFSGRGFLITDGVELKFSKAGNAYARLPLVFKNTKKTDNGYTHDKEILIEATAFGFLAESLSEVISGRTDVNVTGQLHAEEYEGKLQVKLLLNSAWPVKEERNAVSTGAAKEEAWPF